ALSRARSHRVDLSARRPGRPAGRRRRRGRRENPRRSGRLTYGWVRLARGGRSMPQLTVEGVGTFEVPAGKRLVLALEDEAGIDQLHACGGNARCTTCRVEFISGEPATMTEAERSVLTARGLTGVRLSCQILCDHDMTV